MLEHKEIPTFESTIPDHLLTGNDEARKWMMTEMSKGQQKMDWLARETLAQSATLMRVENLALQTNGRVSKLETRAKENEVIFQEAKSKLESHDSIIHPIASAIRVLTNPFYRRIALISVLLMGLGAYSLYASYKQDILNVVRHWLFES